MGIRPFQILLTLSNTPPKVKQIPRNFLNWPTQAENVEELAKLAAAWYCLHPPPAETGHQYLALKQVQFSTHYCKPMAIPG